MANVLTQNIWVCDSLGIISPGPVLVKAINFYPNAVADAFTLLWWDEATPATYVRGVTYTITTSTDDTVTSTGNFASTWADGKVAKCLKTTGSDATVYGLIKTAGNNNAFVTHLSPFTAEASKVGDWDCYNTYTAFKMLQPTLANTHESKFVSFGGDGMWFPNLALDSLSTSAAVHIYVG